MIFVIHYVSADTCGNSESYLVGYVEADSIEEVRKEFPRGFLTGFEVEPLEVSSVESLRQKAEKNIRNRVYY